MGTAPDPFAQADEEDDELALAIDPCAVTIPGTNYHSVSLSLIFPSIFLYVGLMLLLDFINNKSYSIVPGVL